MLFFKDFVKGIKKQNSSFLKYSTPYFSYYDLTLQCTSTDNAVQGTVPVGSIIGKPGAGEGKTQVLSHYL